MKYCGILYYLPLKHWLDALEFIFTRIPGLLDDDNFTSHLITYVHVWGVN